MQVLTELRSLTPERFHAIYVSLENKGFGPLDGEVAKSLRFRPQGVRKLPIEQRARRAKALLETTRNTELAYELFGAYLLKTRKDLVTGFLDATGVAHENGMIEDVERAQPDRAKIADAVADLDAKHPAEDVTLYLAMCAQQWPKVAELDALWKQRHGAATGAR
jgi:hypothetical protein